MLRLFVTRFTDETLTPSISKRADSTLLTHDAQVIPETDPLSTVPVVEFISFISTDICYEGFAIKRAIANSIDCPHGISTSVLSI